MNYRCPKCNHRLTVRSLFFHDVSACPGCGEKVVLGDFLAFFMAAIAMSVSAIATLYILSNQLDEYLVAAGYALSVGMAAGVVVLLVLGRAKPFRRVRIVRRTRPASLADGPAQPRPKG